jgi:TPR repeat protein
VIKPRHALKIAAACAALAFGAASLCSAPIDLLLPEERDTVLKYYEAQFSSDRRDEMIAHASTNKVILAMAELSKSRQPEGRLDWQSRSEIKRLLLSAAGEDFATMTPALGLSRVPDFDASPTSQGSRPLAAEHREAILTSAARGGMLSKSQLGQWKLTGEEVIQDEAGGWALLSGSATSSSATRLAYAKSLLTRSKKAKEALVHFDILAKDHSSPFVVEATSSAMVAAYRIDQVGYLTWGYIYKQKYRFGLSTLGTEFANYEKDYAGKSDWWPWSLTYGAIAQAKAAEVVAAYNGQRAFKQVARYEQLAPWDARLESAHYGDSVAMYDVGVAYLKGLDGFPRNEKAAREWFRLSANLGFIRSCYNYGICLTEAVGGPADANEAVRMFRIGAMRSDPLSQHNLGTSYGMGRGVARDYEEAAAWWILCESKVPQAKANLASLVANSGPGFMAKAKARSEVLRNEITIHFFTLKKDLIW